MKIRNASAVDTLTTNLSEISSASTQSLVIYPDNVLDALIIKELVALLNNYKLTPNDILKKLEECNSNV
jgi:hypothetical protein